MTAQSAWLWAPGDAMLDAQHIGGKARQLAALQQMAETLGAAVPEFVVLRTEVFDTFFTTLAPDAPFPEPLAAAIDAALRTAGLAQSLLAVRSSATAEDGATTSFAGQFATVLGVHAADRHALHAAVRSVWMSVHTAHAAAYNARHALEPVRMAVILQALIDPVASGVAFGMDPVTGDRSTTVISAVYGLGEGLVSGELDADCWHVRGDSATAPAFTAALKTHAIRVHPDGGTRRCELEPQLAHGPVLSDESVQRLAALVRTLSSTLGAPQDVEWVMRTTPSSPTHELLLLQTRPVTTGAPLAPPDANDPRGKGRRVWDNSNIVESYSGVTTPLTFTFARSVYEDVYRQFCRLMGVEESLIRDNESTFAHMLGLVRGRVYYSLINWYRLIALLPGFEWNRAFMERMMGVRESLEAAPPGVSTGSRWRDFYRLVHMLIRMLRAHGALATDVPAFRARVERTLAPLQSVSLNTWDAPRIAALYRQLERELLQHWRAPLVNDFFAMVFFGVQGRLLERWLPAAAPTLGNDLLCGEGGIISTEPSRRVMALARQVGDDPTLLAVFESESDDMTLWRALGARTGSAAFFASLESYVDAFGDRCLEELKLETITLREDPAFLVRMIRAYVAQGSVDPDAAWAHERRVRGEAEAAVVAMIGGWKRRTFFWVVRNTRARVRDRENLRFERTRVFGIVRRMVLGIGDAAARAGAIDSARDVFWLSIEETLSLGEQASPPADLRHRIAQRRVMFDRWRAGAAPPDRFETRGPLGEWEGPLDEEIPLAAAVQSVEGDLLGTGCCPGVVRAPVRIVRDPASASALTGCILVAERTDPGWTLLFPATLGLLVQRGSLLSHSAIVAREMALPCIVGIAGLLETLVDGEVVEMNGASGVIRRGVASPSGSIEGGSA